MPQTQLIDNESNQGMQYYRVLKTHLLCKSLQWLTR